MPYALLDDQFHANPKIRAAGLDGAGVYAIALSYCGDYTTDGFVPKWWIEGITGRRKKLLGKLVDVGLWLECEPGDELQAVDRKGNNVSVHVREQGYFIPDFVALNVSSVEAKNKRAERSSSGRKGAIKRWGDSNSHPENGSSSHSKSHSYSDSKRDGKTIARAQAPAGTPSPTPTQEQKNNHPTSSKAEAGLHRANFEMPAPANQKLEPNKADPLIRLVLALRDRDNGTERVLRANYGHLPEAAFHYAREEIERCATTTTSDSGLATSILQRIAETGLIGDEPLPAAPMEPHPEKTRATDWEARARELFERTGDREQVADWLAGLPSLSTAERERVLVAVAGGYDDEPDLGEGQA